MNILIIGNRKHQLLHGLNKAIFENSDENIFSIDILSSESSCGNFDDNGLYSEVYYLKSPNAFLSNRLSKVAYRQISFRNFLKNNIKKYDLIHIHYMENFLLLMVDRFLKSIINSKIIVTIWGSDLLKAKGWQLRNCKKLLLRAEIITIASSELKIKLLDFFPTLSINKIRVIPFFIEALDSIMKESKDNRNNNCEYLNLPIGKKIITIGYNARKQQHHKEIIQSIANSKEIFRDHWQNMFFLFMMTYPNNKKYIEKINKIAVKLLPDCRFITSPLSTIDVIKYRYASDIFIQLQDTDALSASMLEALYAKNVVITGSWLPYSLLANAGTKYITINSINEVGRCLSNIMFEKFDITGNDIVINKLFSKDKLIKKWKDLYY